MRSDYQTSTQITRCRLCYSIELETALSLGAQHLSHFIDLAETVKTPKFPIDLILCRVCGLAQLAHAAPKELLYGEDYGYRSGISNTIKNDLSGIVSEALQLKTLQTDDIVVDVGCNDGTLLDFYPNWLTKVGFDPISKFETEVSSKSIRFINEYFNAAAFIKRFNGKKASVVTAISMFYDLDDPNRFLENILEILDESGVLVIQQNYLISMIDNNAFDNICHEHLEYYSLGTLRFLLSRHGLDVFHASINDINGGSIRTYISRAGSMPIHPSVERIAQDEPDVRSLSYYQSFEKRIDTIKTVINKFVRNKVSNGERIYALGASTRGNTLLQYFDLDSSLIEAAIERNPEKFGKKIASMGIPIIPEEKGRQEAPDYFLVLPWHFKDEIIRREREYIAAGGKLLFPLPVPTIVSQHGVNRLVESAD